MKEPKDRMYYMVATVENTVLYNWNLLRHASKMFLKGKKVTNKAQIVKLSIETQPRCIWEVLKDNSTSS